MPPHLQIMPATPGPRFLYPVAMHKKRAARRVKIAAKYLPENNLCWCSWWIAIVDTLTEEEFNAVEMTLNLFSRNMTSNLASFLKAAAKALPVYYDSAGRKIAA
jgi:hypothetical protein